MTIIPDILKVFACILLVPIISLIINFIFSISPLKSLKSVFTILVAPGIVVHEASHILFCKILGARVVDVTYFKPHGPGFQSYVRIEEIESFLKVFFIGVAPAIVNSFLVYLVLKIYALNILNFSLTIYLMFSLIVGAKPGIQDILVAFNVAAKHPLRFLSEFFALISPLISIFAYQCFQTAFNINLSLTGELTLITLSFSPILYILFYRGKGSRF